MKNTNKKCPGKGETKELPLSLNNFSLCTGKKPDSGRRVARATSTLAVTEAKKLSLPNAKRGPGKVERGPISLRVGVILRFDRETTGMFARKKDPER